jgi:hypothetical protein
MDTDSVEDGLDFKVICFVARTGRFTYARSGHHSREAEQVRGRKDRKLEQCRLSGCLSKDTLHRRVVLDDLKRNEPDLVHRDLFRSNSEKCRKLLDGYSRI